jgi:hypothetical protein
MPVAGVFWETAQLSGKQDDEVGIVMHCSGGKARLVR